MKHKDLQKSSNSFTKKKIIQPQAVGGQTLG